MSKGKPNISQSDIRTPDLLSAIARKLGHEIGNPLTAIISVCSLLDQLSDDGSEAAKKIGRFSSLITKEAWRLSSLNERLVLLLSTEAAVSSPCSISAVLNKALAKLATQSLLDSRSAFKSDIPETLLVDGDLEQLKIVFAELLLNAYLHGSSGDVISVTSEEAGESVCISITNKCEQLYSDLSSLFAPLVVQSDAQKCLGLGLSMVAFTVSRLGGTIEIEQNEVDGEVYFSALVTLPKSGDSTSVADSTDTESKVSYSVLIVEDEDIVSTALENILSFHLGATSRIACAKTVADGKTLLESENFDLIICDINIQRDGDGIELVKECANELTLAPFLLLSGGRPEKETLQYLKTNGHTYLPKPFEPEQLITVVNQLLGKQ